MTEVMGFIGRRKLYINMLDKLFFSTKYQYRYEQCIKSLKKECFDLIGFVQEKASPKDQTMN
jgi:hypothetical protein